MYSIALVVIFGVAIALAAIALTGAFLIARGEKKLGTPPVPAPRRSAASSSDLTLFFRASAAEEALFGGHPLGEREGLLTPAALRAVSGGLLAQLGEVRDAAAVYAAPRLLVPYDDREPGPFYRLRVRSRRPLRVMEPPLAEAELRETLLTLRELEDESLIVAHLEAIEPRRDRALPRLEPLR